MTCEAKRLQIPPVQLRAAPLYRSDVVENLRRNALSGLRTMAGNPNSRGGTQLGAAMPATDRTRQLDRTRAGRDRSAGLAMIRMIVRREMLGMTLIAVFGASSIALAQQGPGPAGPGRGIHGPDMGMMTDTAGYLASLKTELGITEAQKTAWKAYADVVSDAREKMQSVHQAMFKSMRDAI
jgi:hypothetical protein